jgi:ATP adenylyltransferase/5',5'''-P-1,P-4-tetraphosphate phosphorylase II
MEFKNGDTELYMSFNSVGAVGYLLAKCQEEFDALKEIGPINLLEALAFSCK